MERARETFEDLGFIPYAGSRRPGASYDSKREHDVVDLMSTFTPEQLRRYAYLTQAEKDTI